MERKAAVLRIITVCMICVFDLFGIGYMYFRNAKGELLSVHNASDNPKEIFQQNLIVAAPAIIIFFIFFFILKKELFTEMYLRVEGKRQIIVVTVLGLVLAAMTRKGLSINDDKVLIFYNLFYYLIFIAFTEEFILRGVCTYMLKDFSVKVRYLVPNALFGLMHIFAYADYETLTLDYVINFLGSSVLGLMVIGCFFQFLKEKTGTLWIPILIHAIMDYSSIFP